MSERTLFLDEGYGEARGVVMLDGRPERLLIRREGDDPLLMVGSRVAARVAHVDPAIATAFLDLGGGREAILPFKPDAKPVRGSLVEIEIRTEPRRGKLATARPIGPADGAPRLLSAAPTLAEDLARFADDAEIITGPDAREAADDAEAEALQTVHDLPGGGTLAIEPTRALTAIDVDVGDRKGGDSKRVTRQANLAALNEAARLLRLKSVGGLVVFDLAGRGHDGTALLVAARLAFGPDNPGVALGPIGRFGTLELTVPRRARPLTERLCDADGRPSAETVALRALRALQRQAMMRPGAALTAIVATDAAREADRLVRRYVAERGGRLAVRGEAGWARTRIEVSEA